jgi:hypothetical protein
MDLCFIAMFFSCPKGKKEVSEREKNCVIINAHNKQKAHRVILKSLRRTMATRKKFHFTARTTLISGEIQLNNMNESRTICDLLASVSMLFLHEKLGCDCFEIQISPQTQI